MKTKIPKKQIIDACLNNESMAKAASVLKIHFNTFKRHALLYGCYIPNQGLKGGSKRSPVKFELNKILNGEHPHFQTFKLKNRILKEKILEEKCFICGINSWNNKKLNLELDHIDGNRLNHKLSNLRLLCPNCHSQTETFRSRKRYSS